MLSMHMPPKFAFMWLVEDWNPFMSVTMDVELVETICYLLPHDMPPRNCRNAVIWKPCQRLVSVVKHWPVFHTWHTF